MIKSSNTNISRHRKGTLINRISTVGLIVLMLLYLAMTVSSSISLAGKTQLVSEHPFEVVICVGDVKQHVSEMNLRSGRLQLHYSANEIDYAKTAVEELRVSVEEHLSMIEELYLGDEKDVETLRASLESLYNGQGAFFEYASQPGIHEADIEAYDQQHLQPLYSQVNDDAKNIINGAKGKNREYLDEVNSLRSSILSGSVLLMALMIVTLLTSQSILHRQRKELVYRSQLFDNLSLSIDDTFLIRDAETSEVQYCALNMERVLGINADTLSYQGIHNDDAKAIKAAVLNPATVFPYEKLMEYTKPGGEKRQIQVRIYKIQEAGASQFITTFSDRTEEILSRDALQDALLSAQQANAAKTEFLSRMSHEIRTPLNGIIGMMAIAKSNAGDEEKVNDYLQKAEFSARHLLLIINDVLDMSKIESNKMLLLNEPFNIESAISSIASAISSQSQAKDIHFAVSVDGVKPGLSYLGDSMRVSQILLNICSNAVKFTPPGGKVHLKVSCPASKDKADILRFVITDTGIGMEKDTLTKIFQPFEQADASIAGRYGGTGLGMSITKNLVTLMNGTIQADSEPGKGSAFTVDIPFERTESMETPVVEHPNRPGKPLEGIRLLLAEDNAINLEIAEILLKEKGARLQCAGNGKEAAEIMMASEPGEFDAVLMDIQMPVMNGHEAARLIRASSHPDAKRIPIIAVTANAFSDDISAALAAGMDAHISKPLDIEKLCVILEECMCKSGEAEEKRIREMNQYAE